MNLKEMECDDVEWIQMFQDRDLWQDRMKGVMSLQV
jgi:hypothetical protein